MKPTTPYNLEAGGLPAGIYAQPNGGYYSRVKVGSGATADKAQASWDPGTPLDKILRWQDTTRAAFLKKRAEGPARGTLAGDWQQYLAIGGLTKDNKTRRTQQGAFWCAQPAALGAPVLSVAQVQAEAAAAKAGQPVPNHGRTLGQVARTKLDLKRIREILAIAFAPSDADLDPTEHAGTSNHYRMALFHLFTVLDQDDPTAVNPIARVKTRPTQGAQLAGQDMRIVREILRQFPSRFGRSSLISELRLAVLAWIHITPKQLQQLEPASAFHDLPEASREDMIAGAITLTKPARHKGRQKRVPAPETIPLTPWGVEAMRAFAAEPAAWGKFSVASLNKAFRRACRRAQAALAEQGVVVDLSGMTLYHLKHSLATAASIASAGLVDRSGKVRQDPGVSRALDHASSRGGRTTSFYTQAAVAPILLLVNATTARYLDHLFTVPLNAPAALRLVPKADAAG